jgi:hypothetical protein
MENDVKVLFFIPILLRLLLKVVAEKCVAT